MSHKSVNTVETVRQKADRAERKTLCIIGGGVAGLVSAKVLRNDGFEVTVFEKESTIGGVWAESRAYPGLRSNNPCEAYTFSDFDFPESADEFPTAGQIRAYLEAYAGHFGLWPHIRLQTRVLSVSRRETASGKSHPGFRVRVRPLNGSDSDKIETFDFDFVVICNGVFSEPFVPDIKGSDQYEGTVLHSSQFTDKDIVHGKRTIVVGAGKSALDCATFAAEYAESTTLVFRKPHWMIPRYFGKTRVDDLLFNRFSEKIFPLYHNASRTERVLRTMAFPLFWLWETVVNKIVIRQSKMPEKMRPEGSVISGIENNGIGVEFYRILSNGRAATKRAGIESFSGRSKLKLSTGEEIDADVVIFATGWNQDVSFLDEDLRRMIRRDGWFQLYRHILPPKEQRLGFVGYASSGNTPLTSEISAHWLSQHFRGDLVLPDASVLETEIERVRRWTQKVFPRRNSGYFIGAYISSYIDELMNDMGLQTKRTDSFFREYCGAFWSKRYRNVAEERRLLHEN
jgi:dimethylaniline monooxygenase (N-oxide forming)